MAATCRAFSQSTALSLSLLQSNEPCIFKTSSSRSMNIAVCPVAFNLSARALPITDLPDAIGPVTKMTDILKSYQQPHGASAIQPVTQIHDLWYASPGRSACGSPFRLYIIRRRPAIARECRHTPIRANQQSGHGRDDFLILVEFNGERDRSDDG